MKERVLTPAVMGLGVVGFLLMGPTRGQASHEGFAVYDDWSAPTLRSDRWRGFETTGGAQEIQREVSGGRLHMRYRIEGRTTSNSGRSGSANILSPANPTAIDQIEADFRVASMVLTGCALNPTASVVIPAQLQLARFNDGSSTGPGDRTGNRIAEILLRRRSDTTDADGILRVVGRMGRCTNSACSTTAVVSEVELPQTVKVYKKFTLRLVWDEPNDQFLFGVDANPDVSLAYGSDNAGPAISPFLTLGMFHAAANCTAEPTVADAETWVSEVRTNSSAVIP